MAVPGAAAGTVNHNAVTGQPDLETSVPDTEVQPGEQTALTVIIYNDGRVTDGSPSNPDAEQQVKTARSVRVEVEDDHDAPVTVNTNEQFLASLPDGGSAPLDFGLTVDRNATPGEYELTVNASYNYTRAVDLETGRTERASTDETFNVTLVVEETPQFEVVDVASSARVGATGSVNVTMENTGAETARNASVSLTSRNTDLTFAGAGSASRYVDGPWEPGERRTVGYRVAATRSASQQRYAFAAQVTYENTEGNTRQSRSLSLGVTPEPEQTFTVVETAHGVEVGEEGEVTVRLRNDGPVVARDASVTLQSSSGELVFGESASARQYVGRWATGATRTVVVNATALPGAEARNYSLTATVSYEDDEGDSTESRPLQFGLRPAPEREVEFDESDVSSNLRVGEDGTLSGTITNTGEERATNVVVVFETESGTVTPLEREYPVGTLEPGDSASFEFDIEVSGSAEARPRQFTLRPRYRTDDDEQRQGESFDVRGEVQPERDIFDVSAT
ncbi:sialidase, partial [Halobacteriales archaeon SW_7_68_16]